LIIIIIITLHGTQSDIKVIKVKPLGQEGITPLLCERTTFIGIEVKCRFCKGFIYDIRRVEINSRFLTLKSRSDPFFYISRKRLLPEESYERIGGRG
jgi:hypothetical protein